MTRKEAIKMMQEWIGADEAVKKTMAKYGNKEGERYYTKAIEAYRMAIAALEREELEADK